MDLKKIKKLIDLVEQSKISELEITEGEEKIRIACSAPTSFGSHNFATENNQIANPTKAVEPISQEADSLTASINEERNQANTIKSPMVGVFYRASSPNSPVFSEIGQTVKIGDTLCIIEAMKLMNEIKSDRTGIIRTILAEDGEPVEYGEALFVIEPT